MKKFEVKQTLTFYWIVEANSKKEAISLADDMGEVNSTKSKYSKMTAKEVAKI